MPERKQLSWEGIGTGAFVPEEGKIDMLKSVGRQRVSLSVAGGLLILAGYSLQAAVEVFTFSTPTIEGPYRNREIEIQQFDPGLGQLESVGIQLEVTGALTDYFEQFGSSRGRVAINDRLHITLDTERGRPLIILNQSEKNRYRSTRSGGGFDFGGSSGESASYPFDLVGSTTLNSRRDLLQFTGCGLVDLFLSVQETSRQRGFRDCASIENLLTSGASLTVTYCYAPVPEASTWLAAFASLVALFLNRRSQVRFLSRAGR